MDSIGEILKQARLEKNLSKEEVYEITRITTKNIDSLENEQFDNFPNKVYVRAHLRDYSNFLDLDTESLLDRYEQKLVADAPDPEPEKVNIARPAIWAAALLIVAVVAWGIVTLVNSNPVETAVQPPTVINEGAVSTAPAAAETVQTQALPDKVILEISCINDVWVDVRPQGGEQFVGTLSAGEKRIFTSPSEVYVRIARPQAAQIKLNGVIKNLGTEPVTKVYTLENLIKASKAASP